MQRKLRPANSKRKRQAVEVDWLAKHDPAMAIEEAQSAFAAFVDSEAGYHDKLAQVLVRILQIARFMDANWEEWQTFKKHHLLQDLRQKPKNNNKLKAVAYVVEQAMNKTTRARAGKHAIALKGLMLGGIKTDDALEVIKKEGIEELLRQARKLSPRTNKSRPPRPGDDDYFNIDDDEPVKKRRVTLEIEISKKLLAKALLPKGAKGRIVFRSLGHGTGSGLEPKDWICLVAEKVSRIRHRPKPSN
ncbi:hypothetical protein [Lichenihabitans psoromatis]|uniref:hypothetical protein n=1 Tax=Lichenihabitans psoromatis TaxID=2528642 RepID=UPI0010384E16|nr:hypothetical protein [Lichenihabitans psoromatis]